MNGPGKYDEECTLVRERTGASTVVMIVLGGSRGSGFSVQTIERTLAHDLPRLLRDLAGDIEEDQFRTEEKNYGEAR